MTLGADMTAVIAAAVSAVLSQQAGSTGKILNLPEYHGIGSSVSFKSWYDKCNNLFEAFAIKNESRKVANLRLMLKGTAETVLKSYVLKNSDTQVIHKCWDESSKCLSRQDR
ncbi:hypothetical protein AYI69_g4827 [Smittium culicis]|uniref:Uncharacterized protein n=1 Tax=Smittium culicis TaxID=133412 RepID=A0A1R1YAG3_9FUNG|nr:hypothetical protein AYI69_g4827 [Smittium culicis]